MEKKECFFVDDEEFGRLYTGNAEETLEFLQSYKDQLEDVNNGDSFTIKITRKDMTEKEIKALPEI